MGAVDREVFRVLLGLLPRDPPQRKSGHEMNEWCIKNVMCCSETHTCHISWKNSGRKLGRLNKMLYEGST